MRSVPAHSKISAIDLGLETELTVTPSSSLKLRWTGPKPPPETSPPLHSTNLSFKSLANSRSIPPHSISMLLKLSNPAECLPSISVALAWSRTAMRYFPPRMYARSVWGSESSASRRARRRWMRNFSATASRLSRRRISLRSDAERMRSMPVISLSSPLLSSPSPSSSPRPSSSRSAAAGPFPPITEPTFVPIDLIASVASMNLE
mmetsp:Transcript_4013/g.10170  ORF Transcript_4013/g.10170 Transcript_4013/m.10170 type:complete len:205 (+) Transcript_4013:157-771(+)